MENPTAESDITSLAEQAHREAADTVMQRLDVSARGLNDDEAARRLAAHGPNRLPAAARPGLMRRALAQFNNVLIHVLLAAAVIAVLLGHVVDAGVIVAVVLVNALIGLIQEGKAEKAMDAIRNMLAPTVSVLRNEQRRTLAADALVPGDVVFIEAGDRVGADLRLLNAHGLQIQEAILTGESVPVEKNVTPVSGEVGLGDRRCMAYSGTLVTSGQGRGVVVATGSHTQIGRISGLLAGVETLTTPLLIQIGAFARWLTAFILAVAAVLLIFGYFVRGYLFADLFMAILSLSVAAIPEGLPAVLSITLAIGVQTMARRNAIVRRLPAIETLGSVSVICTDKTGTLTRNEMMVVSACIGSDRYAVAGSGYAPYGVITDSSSADESAAHETLYEMARVAALCNDAALHETNDEWTVAGDPMEGALLAFAGKAGFDPQRDTRDWTRTDAIPFDPTRRFMATLQHDHHGHALVAVKGAPETLLGMCTRQCTSDGETAPLDPDHWRKLGDEISANGQRLLALAYRSGTSPHTVLEYEDVGDLVFLGLVGLIDPPRPETAQAVAECHAAGIRVKMITGDHAGTARAIAREIGLRNVEHVLTGVDIDTLDDAMLKEKVVDVDVFARTSPEHKLRLVTALQAHDLTVAMTGDGVNDAPALKRADAGIAMGLKGSEAAKESAELVLADDNFASIVAAVREGRTVYDNIKKVISWTLPTNAGEAATIVVALMAGVALPITPVQILWVNMITAVTLGIALAFEPTEQNTMRRPPRPRTAPLLGAELGWHILLVSVLFLIGVYGMFTYALQAGFSEDVARTIALNTLVVMKIFHLFFIRNIYGTSLTWRAVRGTKVVWACIVTATAAQFGITYLPWMQVVFGTAPVPVLEGMIIVCVGVLLFAIIETEKQLRLRLRALNKAE